MEMLDILDENGNLTGQKESRETVHKNKLWHIHVGVWLMNEQGEILFQKRSPNKKVNPNKWTRTGGHVSSEETPLQGIQREVEEEIGVEIPTQKFELINIEKYEGEKSRHYSYNYFVFVNYKIDEYTMQKEEVIDLKYITIEEMEIAKKNDDKSYTFVDWENADEVLTYLKNKRKELINK